MTQTTAAEPLPLASHFDRTLTLTPTGTPTGTGTDDGGGGGGKFAVELDPSWASLRGVHGGYVTALAVRAAELTAPDRAVRTIATSFLRPADVGPAELRIDLLRAGRSFSTVIVDVVQGDRSIANTRVTLLAALDESAQAELRRSWSAAVGDRPAPREQCVSFTPPPTIRHFAQAELLIDPDTIPVGDGSFARIAGHVRPNEGRPIDAAWLAMIGDWFPPSPFRRFDPPIGGVSIDYTVHLHDIPAASEEWIEGVFVTPNCADGIALEHGTLATPDGTLLAETFHTRWTG